MRFYSISMKKQQETKKSKGGVVRYPRDGEKKGVKTSLKR